jgi:putative ABC transport system substrate-binding protein
MMRRRKFIMLVGGAAAAWPLAARAQQSAGRMRRIGVLMSVAAEGPEGQARLAAFLKGLQQLGWTEGRNLRVDTRWGAGNAELTRKYAAELAALGPDVIFASGDPVMTMQQVTRTVPIVFTIIADPVGAGLVESLARPGGNVTGFMSYEHGFGAKWLEMLKEIAPGVKRVAVIRNSDESSGIAQFAGIQGVAGAFGVELSPIGTRDAAEIERSITAFARSPNGGLIVTGSAPAAIHHRLIITLAERYKLPAVYFGRFVVAAGGLISYGPDLVVQHRFAAGYVDRILKGEKPADLPVQAPTRYEVAINLKTAKALGIDVPPMLLVRADEVIE